jgi:hypothetical protein
MIRVRMEGKVHGLRLMCPRSLDTLLAIVREKLYSDAKSVIDQQGDRIIDTVVLENEEIIFVQ